MGVTFVGWTIVCFRNIVKLKLHTIVTVNTVSSIKYGSFIRQ